MKPTFTTPFLMPITANRRRTPKMGMQFSTKLYIDTENLYEELKKKHLRHKIKQNKILRPVMLSRWFIDFFEEVDYLLAEQKKRRISMLRIREPVTYSEWNDENDWCLGNIIEN